MNDQNPSAQPGADGGTTGYTWVGAEVVWAEVPVDVDAARQLLPPGLELDDPAVATVFVADYPFTTFGSVYKEAAVLLHCRDAKGPHLHCPWMVVDDDTALILGREMLGFTKKMAEMTVDVDGDQVTATTSRRDTELIRIEAALTVDEPAPPALFDRRFVNLFGSIVNGMCLIEVPAAGESFRSCRSGSGKVVLGSSDRDPLALLAPPTEATVHHAVLDFAAEGTGAPAVVGSVTDEAYAFTRFFARLM